MLRYLYSFFILTLNLLSGFIFSQEITVEALGGEGKNVNWEQLKIKAQSANTFLGWADFLNQDCEQGIVPLRATSTLPNQGGKNYALGNINDNNPMTAWVEGEQSYGIGEYFEIRAPLINVIYNGYQSSPKRWIENSRVKIFRVYRDNNPLCYLFLKDEMGKQYFDLPRSLGNATQEHIYKFEIVEVYKGTKWADVAISEINYANCD